MPLRPHAGAVCATLASQPRCHPSGLSFPPTGGGRVDRTVPGAMFAGEPVILLAFRPFSGSSSDLVKLIGRLSTAVVAVCVLEAGGAARGVSSGIRPVAGDDNQACLRASEDAPAPHHQIGRRPLFFACSVAPSMALLFLVFWRSTGCRRSDQCLPRLMEMGHTSLPTGSGRNDRCTPQDAISSHASRDIHTSS